MPAFIDAASDAFGIIGLRIFVIRVFYKILMADINKWSFYAKPKISESCQYFIKVDNHIRVILYYPPVYQLHAFFIFSDTLRTYIV